MSETMYDTYNITEVETINNRILRCTLSHSTYIIVIDINREVFPVALGDDISVTKTSSHYQVNYTTISNTNDKLVASAGGLLIECKPSITVDSVFTLGLTKATTQSYKKPN
ncbi:hypothetical protein EhV18_00493 [Emiliania huxleyi virus 18]|nr:hypothetical protein EhV18_00493 [Emiliania huxleyi virus 18]